MYPMRHPLIEKIILVLLGCIVVIYGSLLICYCLRKRREFLAQKRQRSRRYARASRRMMASTLKNCDRMKALPGIVTAQQKEEQRRKTYLAERLGRGNFGSYCSRTSQV